MEPDKSETTLRSLMESGLRLHESVMNGGIKSQDDIRKGILMLEDATKLVSIQDIFSRNENIQEIPTEHLTYFLLPALLGDFNSKIIGSEDRLQILNVSEIYYKDYLERLREYEAIPQEWKLSSESQENEENISKDTPPDLATLNREREIKVQRYKEKRDLEIELETLKKSTDEDIIRNYHLKTLRRFALHSMDELRSIRSEKPILKFMATRQGVPLPPSTPAQNGRPLAPIVITRDAVQKEVFGLGYKHLPVYTLEEFYEKRVREGWFIPPGESSASLMDKVNSTPEFNDAEEEQKNRIKDEKIDNDDEETIAKARAFDEYKDDHKRGEGNRHNKG